MDGLRWKPLQTVLILPSMKAWDMLCGKLEPELGGAPHYLDIMGIIYYQNNQWDVGAEFPWHLGDSRRIPLVQPDFQRIPCKPYVHAIHDAQRLTNKFLLPRINPVSSKPLHISTSQSKGNNMLTIFVFSHLSWNFLFQRLQHLLDFQRLPKRCTLS